MKKKILISISEDAENKLRANGQALGMTLSQYIDMLGHSKLQPYHIQLVSSKRRKKNEQKINSQQQS